MRFLAKEVVVALNASDAVRIEMKEKWKSKIRCTFYIFPCLDCGKEVEVRKFELKRAMGRCFPCTAIFNGKDLIARNGKEPYRALFNKLVAQAKLRGKDWNLTFEEFLTYTKIHACHYCGDKVIWAASRLGKGTSAGNLDRKDTNLGYSLENCVVCCWPCNQKKRHLFTYEQFLEIAILIRKWKQEEPVAVDNRDLAFWRTLYFNLANEVEQTLGKALGYPWYKDDQKNFPGATEKNGVCVGDHVPESILAEASRNIKFWRNSGN